MSNSKHKKCEKCNTYFICKVDSLYCNCFTIQLSENIREILSVRFKDCLCINCLQEFVRNISSFKE